MTSLALQEIDVFAEVVEESVAIKEDIGTLLDSIVNSEISLATNYAKLGRLVLRVQQGKFWQAWGYQSFGQFVIAVGEKINRARSMIYAYADVADKLLPHISESDLEKMGISRAQELARFVKASGRQITPSLLAAALDPEVKLNKLHTDVSEELHERGEALGTWMEYGGFYALPDERKEIQLAIDTAKREDSDILNLPDHYQRKAVLLAWAREFVSSNPGERR